MTNTKKLLLILLILAALLGTLLIRKSNTEITPPITSAPETVQTPEQPETPDPGTNYDLFAMEGITYPGYIQYKNIPDVSTGQYAGYHRVMAFITEGPGGQSIFTFATKDYKTFLVDSTIYPYEGYSTVEKDLKAERPIFNTEKVTGIAQLPTNFPSMIDDGDFVYVRGSALYETPKTEELVELPSSNVLTFYARKFDYSRNPELPADVIAGEKSIATSAGIVVKDKEGIWYSYSFLTREMYDRRTSVKPGEWSADYSKFYIESDLHMNESHYASYGDFLPGGCGGVGSTYTLTNVSDADFVAVGKTKGGVTLYKPKNPESVLNKAEYHHKVGAYKEYEYWLEANRISTYPAYEEYILKNPVLVFKDNFNRFVAVGEFDYQLPGGCGKPVIYLYPETPTNVSVSFMTPTRIDRAIPNYDGVWNVLAHPDGTLLDLQKEKTACDEINYSLSGAEYAKEACPKGIYPYLYWSGTTANAYPHQNEGWVVPKNELPEFLSSKLTEIGLSEKERSDMLGFWVPEMQSKNAPYYRVAFIQTKEMNAFIPMKVTPTPDTVFRIFLDWQPLSKKPASVLPPQKLGHLERNGFTLVEWGGLRQ